MATDAKKATELNQMNKWVNNGLPSPVIRAPFNMEFPFPMRPHPKTNAGGLNAARKVIIISNAYNLNI